MESSDDQLLASFSGTLFDWSRVWRLTSSDSLPMFPCGLSFFSFFPFYTLSFPLVFFSLPYVFLHKVVFLNINLYYLSKKKKKNLVSCIFYIKMFC